MSPKLKAMLAKASVAALFAVPLGLLVRLNWSIDEKIDEKYNPKKDEDPTS